MDSTENTPGPRPVPPAAEYEACAPGALPSGQMAFVRAIQEKFLRGFAEQLADRLETPGHRATRDGCSRFPPLIFLQSDER